MVGMERAVIVEGARTPIGKFLGAFAEVLAVDLGVHATREALRRAGVEPEAVDIAVYGHARQAGNGPNTWLQVAYRSGLPQEVPGFNVNMACGSGVKAVEVAAQQIALGEAQVAVAGGFENMTRTPAILDRMRFGYRMGNAPVFDGMSRDGFLDPLCGLVMGETATVVEDEHPRPETTLGGLVKLPPVFAEDGTVTAGNSSGITDGAAALVVMSESRAKSEGREPLARIVASSSAGVDPAYMGIGVVPAVQKVLEKTGFQIADFEVVEINEAFAAQVLAVDRELKLDHDRLNPNGGGNAPGHPIGMSWGPSVLTTADEKGEKGYSL